MKKKKRIFIMIQVLFLMKESEYIGYSVYHYEGEDMYVNIIQL